MTLLFCFFIKRTCSQYSSNTASGVFEGRKIMVLRPYTYSNYLLLRSAQYFDTLYIMFHTKERKNERTKERKKEGNFAPGLHTSTRIYTSIHVYTNGFWKCILFTCATACHMSCEPIWVGINAR